MHPVGATSTSETRSNPSLLCGGILRLSKRLPRQTPHLPIPLVCDRWLGMVEYCPSRAIAPGALQYRSVRPVTIASGGDTRQIGNAFVVSDRTHRRLLNESGSGEQGCGKELTIGFVAEQVVVRWCVEANDLESIGGARRLSITDIRGCVKEHRRPSERPLVHRLTCLRPTA